MDTTEKQESQKTVVAFIAGLLIGGLLVWVFSSSPKDKPVTTTTDTETTEESDSNTTTDETASTNTDTNTSSASEETTKPVTASNVTIADQPAGTVVKIGAIPFPTTNGWVVIRDFENGVTGKILGAARYSTDSGLVPDSVELLRSTIAGKTYRVVFLKEDGDKKLDTTKDTEVTGLEAFFKAQ